MSETAFRVIPVLDLKAGKAVHAIGGIRSQYQPVQSCLHTGSEPVKLARAARDTLGLRVLYLADLDAIAGSPPARSLYGSLTALGLTVWVDAGLKDQNSLAPFQDLDHVTLVAGLETVKGPAAMSAILEAASPDRLVVSLDLFDGQPLTRSSDSWTSKDPVLIARQLFDLGVRRLILLDLSRVGTGRGTGTEGLLASIQDLLPSAEITVGGGISGIDDILRLKAAGAAGVLVGSAIHDGRIGTMELARISDENP